MHCILYLWKGTEKKTARGYKLGFMCRILAAEGDSDGSQQNEASFDFTFIIQLENYVFLSYRFPSSQWFPVSIDRLGHTEQEIWISFDSPTQRL